ncbi:hypothetical protein KQX54_019320 [Cotesia glomerata]|uniref:Uncharacterized protein n=1 Tax=Cotesia glomerata TaxID=32391 RepID=A0AAV7IY36_COTGL|nr:hypothetical protein KQX54_019320 [Cotesia glomerata]
MIHDRESCAAQMPLLGIGLKYRNQSYPEAQPERGRSFISVLIKNQAGETSGRFCKFSYSQWNEMVGASCRAGSELPLPPASFLLLSKSPMEMSNYILGRIRSSCPDKTNKSRPYPSRMHILRPREKLQLPAVLLLAAYPWQGDWWQAPQHQPRGHSEPDVRGQRGPNCRESYVK